MILRRPVYATPEKARKRENSELNSRKCSKLQWEACPKAHPPEFARKVLLLPAATATKTQKHAYFARGVVGHLRFVARLEE